MIDRNLIIMLGSFIIVALAAHDIGDRLSRLRLPRITTYLAVGALAGPFFLSIMPLETPIRLHFLYDLTLAIIAFVAGSEVRVTELRARWRAIAMMTGGVLIAALLFIGAALLALTTHLSLTRDLDLAGRIAVALLGTTILLALSPPSTIAVIKELCAHGPFTQTILSVTVVMDVIIVALFGVSAALARVLLDGSSLGVGFVGAVILDLGASVALGASAGWLLTQLLSLGGSDGLKIGGVLLIGGTIFAATHAINGELAHHIGREARLEPLLAALVGGFWVANVGPHRDQFAHLLHRASPPIYIGFFTLTGVALEVDALWASLATAAVLFGVRLVAIVLGATTGSILAGESHHLRHWGWMALITQAGIALGLAHEVAVTFPALGDQFSTMIVAVVVLNEISGPVFLKTALRLSGETPLLTPNIAPFILEDGVLPDTTLPVSSMIDRS